MPCRAINGIMAERGHLAARSRAEAGAAGVRSTALEGVAKCPHHCSAVRGNSVVVDLMIRLCRQPTPSTHQPRTSRGVDAAKPHMRSPLVAAGTKIPNARGGRAPLDGTNLMHGISQPAPLTVRPSGIRRE